MPAFVRAILIQESAEGGLSYKVKNPRQLRNLPGIHAVLLLCGLTRISGMKEVFV